MPNYVVKNISRILIYENLDTQDADGKREVLTLRRRATATLTEGQHNSRAIKKLIARGLLRSNKA